MFQFAARAAALVFLVVSVMLTPTASYWNRVTLTEVITRAPDVCDQKMARGSADKQLADFACPQGEWEFNAALDDVASLPAFGLAANKPGVRDAMLDSYVGGTAPSCGEQHYAFAPDCFPRAPMGGTFAAPGPVPDEAREETCQSLVDEWAQLAGSHSRGVVSGPARWVVGRPVRFSHGAPGGNR